MPGGVKPSLKALTDSLERRAVDAGPAQDLTEQERQARVDLVSSVVAGIAASGGMNAASAGTAAKIEGENNQVAPVPPLPGPAGVEALIMASPPSKIKQLVEAVLNAVGGESEKATNTSSGDAAAASAGPKVPANLQPFTNPGQSSSYSIWLGVSAG